MKKKKNQIFPEQNPSRIKTISMHKPELVYQLGRSKKFPQMLRKESDIDYSIAFFVMSLRFVKSGRVIPCRVGWVTFTTKNTLSTL